MLVIGPTLLSGIGQHAKKYTELFPEWKYIQVSEHIPECECAFIFALPVEYWFDKIVELKKKIKHLHCMTVCETETVHEDYGKLFKLFDRIAVPSEFCKNVFSRQFPDTEFYVIRAHIPHKDTYTFYHIGNVMDQRKNFRAILESFVRLNKPDTKLLVKATCNQPITINLPNVEVINGLVPDDEMDKIHRMHININGVCLCHCTTMSHCTTIIVISMFVISMIVVSIILPRTSYVNLALVLIQH